MGWTFYNASGELQINDGGLSNIVEDTSPQLGGDLDANGSDITEVGHIGFLASQDASAGANDLDDYEEGTWTPGIGDDNLNGSGESQAYSTQVGVYTKVGRKVAGSIGLVISDLGTLTTSQQASITGWPFTSLSTGSSEASVYFGWTSSFAFNNATEHVTATLAANNTYSSCYNWDGTSGVSALLISEWSLSGGCRGFCNYFSA